MAITIPVTTVKNLYDLTEMAVLTNTSGTEQYGSVRKGNAELVLGIKKLRPCNLKTSQIEIPGISGNLDWCFIDHFFRLNLGEYAL